MQKIGIIFLLALAFCKSGIAMEKEQTQANRTTLTVNKKKDQKQKEQLSEEEEEYFLVRCLIELYIRKIFPLELIIKIAQSTLSNVPAHLDSPDVDLLNAIERGAHGAVRWWLFMGANPIAQRAARPYRRYGDSALTLAQEGRLHTHDERKAKQFDVILKMLTYFLEK